MKKSSRGYSFPPPYPSSARCSGSAKVRRTIAQKQPSQRSSSFVQLTLAIVGGWVVAHVTLPAHAATLINNTGVQFEQDTTIESNFVESHGAYQSTFGVMNLDTKEKTPLLTETKASDDSESIFKPSSRQNQLGLKTDFLGTPGNAVPKPVAQYKFKANQRYVLYLESSYNGRPTGILYSNDVLNPSREQQARFAGNPSDLCGGGITVGWDDTGSKLVRDRAQQDRDFDDFVVQMQSKSCAIGGGEEEIQQITPPPPPVGLLPAAGGRFNPLLLAPLAAGLLLIRDGNDNGNKGGGGGNITPPIVPPINPPIVPPVNPPTESIPEPLTILGSGSAIALTALLERRRKRKRK